jgi:hypothetical protein
VIQTGISQPTPNVGGVPIHDLAEQELGADGKDLDDHAGPSTAAVTSVP